MRLLRFFIKARPLLAAAPLLVAWPVIEPAGAQSSAAGETIYANRCAACHKTGLLGAPKLGVPADWTERLPRGRDTLLAHAIKGFNQMPPKGGNPTLTEQQVAAATDFMIARAGPAQPTDGSAAAAGKAPVKAAPKPMKVPVARAPTSGANRFNRLMRPPSTRNPPPAKDGIHDPASDGTHTLQSPRDAFAQLPKANAGNRVDWVAALEKGQIEPRYDRVDTNAKPVIMDLNIVREVKGSMPNVVYPHKEHTEWLDCSNCHPAIFVPQKGANQISMAGILLGKQCGVCHGKVAFPVAECRRCHSGSK